MSISNHSLGRRFVAAAGAVAVTFGALLGMSPAANAAPEFGNIDEDASGNILIHKHENQVGTEVVGDPDKATGIPSDPVADVTFTAYDILDASGNKIDLTVPGNWDFLADLTVSADGTTLTHGDPAPSNGPWTVGNEVRSATTGADGKATIPVDSIGAYVVVETDAPETVVQKALPFIVTIPYPYEDGWIYDVNVYPKNGVVSVGKTITEQPDAEVGLGSVVKFPVTTLVPGLAPNTSFDNYVVQDTLDNRLTELGVDSVTVDGVAVDASYYDVLPSPLVGQTVRVEFNAAGLEWLKTQGNKEIVTVFKGTVSELGNGVIENEATLFVNDPQEENGIDSNMVHTNWGDLVIKKIDGSDKEATLEGAIFEVYNAEAPYAGTCDAAVATGDALTVGGKTEFTTDANGQITIPGLFVSDSENDPKDAAERCYVIKEIQAPAGFVTPTGDAAFTGVTVKIGATTALDVTVENVQQDVPELPLTGAQGRVLMIIAGIGLLAIAAGLVLRNRARATQR